MGANQSTGGAGAQPDFDDYDDSAAAAEAAAKYANAAASAAAAAAAAAAARDEYFLRRRMSMHPRHSKPALMSAGGAGPVTVISAPWLSRSITEPHFEAQSGVADQGRGSRRKGGGLLSQRPEKQQAQQQQQRHELLKAEHLQRSGSAHMRLEQGQITSERLERLSSLNQWTKFGGKTARRWQQGEGSTRAVSREGDEGDEGDEGEEEADAVETGRAHYGLQEDYEPAAGRRMMDAGGAGRSTTGRSTMIEPQSSRRRSQDFTSTTDMATPRQRQLGDAITEMDSPTGYSQAGIGNRSDNGTGSGTRSWAALQASDRGMAWGSGDGDSAQQERHREGAEMGRRLVEVSEGGSSRPRREKEQQDWRQQQHHQNERDEVLPEVATRSRGLPQTRRELRAKSFSVHSSATGARGQDLERELELELELERELERELELEHSPANEHRQEQEDGQGRLHLHESGEAEEGHGWGGPKVRGYVPELEKRGAKSRSGSKSWGGLELVGGPALKNAMGLEESLDEDEKETCVEEVSEGRASSQAYVSGNVGQSKGKTKAAEVGNQVGHSGQETGPSKMDFPRSRSGATMGTGAAVPARRSRLAVASKSSRELEEEEKEKEVEVGFKVSGSEQPPTGAHHVNDDVSAAVHEFKRQNAVAPGVGAAGRQKPEGRKGRQAGEGDRKGAGPGAAKASDGHSSGTTTTDTCDDGDPAGFNSDSNVGSASADRLKQKQMEEEQRLQYSKSSRRSGRQHAPVPPQAKNSNYLSDPGLDVVSRAGKGQGQSQAPASASKSGSPAGVVKVAKQRDSSVHGSGSLRRSLISRESLGAAALDAGGTAVSTPTGHVRVGDVVWGRNQTFASGEAEAIRVKGGSGCDEDGGDPLSSSLQPIQFRPPLRSAEPQWPTTATAAAAAGRSDPPNMASRPPSDSVLGEGAGDRPNERGAEQSNGPDVFDDEEDHAEEGDGVNVCASRSFGRSEEEEGPRGVISGDGYAEGDDDDEEDDDGDGGDDDDDGGKLESPRGPLFTSLSLQSGRRPPWRGKATAASIFGRSKSCSAAASGGPLPTPVDAMAGWTADDWLIMKEWSERSWRIEERLGIPHHPRVRQLLGELGRIVDGYLESEARHTHAGSPSSTTSSSSSLGFSAQVPPEGTWGMMQSTVTYPIVQQGEQEEEDKAEEEGEGRLKGVREELGVRSGHEEESTLRADAGAESADRPESAAAEEEQEHEAFRQTPTFIARRFYDGVRSRMYGGGWEDDDVAEAVGGAGEEENEGEATGHGHGGGTTLDGGVEEYMDSSLARDFAPYGLHDAGEGGSTPPPHVFGGGPLGPLSLLRLPSWGDIPPDSVFSPFTVKRSSSRRCHNQLQRLSLENAAATAAMASGWSPGQPGWGPLGAVGGPGRSGFGLVTPRHALGGGWGGGPGLDPGDVSPAGSELESFLNFKAKTLAALPEIGRPRRRKAGGGLAGGSRGGGGVVGGGGGGGGANVAEEMSGRMSTTRMGQGHAEAARGVERKDVQAMFFNVRRSSTRGRRGPSAGPAVVSRREGMLRAAVGAHRQFHLCAAWPAAEFFDQLLVELLDATDSTFGFIAACSTTALVALQQVQQQQEQQQQRTEEKQDAEARGSGKVTAPFKVLASNHAWDFSPTGHVAAATADSDSACTGGGDAPSTSPECDIGLVAAASPFPTAAAIASGGALATDIDGGQAVCRGSLADMDEIFRVVVSTGKPFVASDPRWKPPGAAAAGEAAAEATSAGPIAAAAPTASRTTAIGVEAAARERRHMSLEQSVSAAAQSCYYETMAQELGLSEEAEDRIHTMLAVPLFFGVAFVGVFAVANRQGGYPDGLVEDLAPLAEAIALALRGYELRQRWRDANQLALLMLKVTTEGVVCIAADGIVLAFNPTAAKLLDLPLGKKPDLLKSMGDDDDEDDEEEEEDEEDSVLVGARKGELCRPPHDLPFDSLFQSVMGRKKRAKLEEMPIGTRFSASRRRPDGTKLVLDVSLHPLAEQDSSANGSQSVALLALLRKRPPRQPHSQPRSPIASHAGYKSSGSGSATASTSVSAPATALATAPQVKLHKKDVRQH